MKKVLKIIFGCFGILAIILVLFVGLLFFIFRFLQICDNQLIEEVLSPNKELKTMIFSVGCGATTGFSTQISIVGSDYKLKKSDKGNVFIADDDHGKANTNGEIIEVKTKWIDNKTLQIEYAKNARIFKNKTSKKGVKIIYKVL
jgi:hypothetical protein